MGYDEKRGDKVEVVSMRFAGPEALAEPAALPFWDRLEKADVIRLAEAGFLALVAIMCLALVLRPMALRLTLAAPGPVGALPGGGGAIAGPDGAVPFRPCPAQRPPATTPRCNSPTSRASCASPPSGAWPNWSNVTPRRAWRSSAAWITPEGK